MNPNAIDELIQNAAPELHAQLRAVQKQWAADLEAYEVLDSRYRSMRDQLFALTNQMVHEANHIHDVREMRTQ